MDEGQLLTLIKNYEQASLGSQVAAGATISTTVYPSNQAMTTIQVDRYNALNAFWARPLGNEVENRSQVVLPVVRDTMAWIMPQLMRMFAASKSICRFDPENEQDEEQAETETEVVNQVFMAQNSGLMVLHDFFWDSLLMRNGYAQVYTREWKSVREEKYKGMDITELTSLLEDMADEDVKVLEHREYLRDLVLPLPQGGPPPILPPGAGLEAAPPAPQQPLVVQVPTYDVKIRRARNNKRIVVSAIPPEEMRVSPRARNGLEDVSFAEHMGLKTRSELIQEGFDKNIVDGLSAGRPGWLDIDALARNKLVDQLSIENPSDFAMQEVEFATVMIRVDYDGDGIAELREVLVGGDKVLSNEMIEETRFVSGESIRMPHRHTGLSIYDLVMDLQVIQTTMFRAGLDNLTVANNLRIAVDWRNVNMDDLLTSRPHGPIRGNGPPGNWIQPIQMPTNVMAEVIPMLDYIDKLRTNRTGIGKGTMGLDADELQNVTKGGQLAALSAAALIVELIARMLAEGCQGIFQKIRSEMIRNQDKPMSFKIRGKWTEVDPSSWRRDRRTLPNVGLGSGNREEMRANIELLIPAQTQLLQVLMQAPPQVYAKAYETFKTVCESLGFNNPERFAIPPNSEDYNQIRQQMQAQQQAGAQAAQNAPQVQAAKIRAQTELAKQQAENQREQGQQQSELMEGRIQLVHEQLQGQQQREHEALQGHRDREIDLDATHQKMMADIIKALSPIIAGQLKGTDQNAGQVLAEDTAVADKGIEGGGGRPSRA